MLTVACVNAGNYLGRGMEYVAALRDGVAAHLSIPHRFVCFTDASMVPMGVEAIPLPGDLDGWWNKLWMFAPGVIPSGRVLYLDLDTVVTGSLAGIAGYLGPFAALRDFYRVWGLGSGAMVWQAGGCADIWTDWAATGRHRFKGGDQSWIEYKRPGAHRLQDHFGGIVSYKAHCAKGVPANARLVCFHGDPRPHETSLWPQPQGKAAA